MPAKSKVRRAEVQKTYAQRQKERGLTRVAVWVPNNPEAIEQVHLVAEAQRRLKKD